MRALQLRLITVIGVLVLTSDCRSQSPTDKDITAIIDVIADADGDGVIDLIGQQVKIRASVTTEHFKALRVDLREYRAYVQDDSGGLRIVAPARGPLRKLVYGVQADIYGIVDQYNGCPCLKLDHITDFRPAQIIEPRKVSLDNFDGEALTGQLIQVHGRVSYSDKRYYLRLNDDLEDEKEIKLRLFLRPAKNYVPFIAKVREGLTVDVIGIAEQYVTTAPFKNGYRIRPRQLEDIIIEAPSWSRQALSITLWTAPVLLIFGLLMYTWRTRRANKQLESPQTQRTQALGTLAGGIAHEFNNYLLAIMGFAEIAKMELDKDSPSTQHLDQVLEAGHRAKALVEQILAFGRTEGSELILVNARQTIEEAMILVRAIMPSNIIVRTNLSCTTEVIMADRGELSQLLLNLGTNSNHAMPNGGSFSVSATSVEISDEQSRQNGLKTPGSYILLEVADTGIGMDEELLSHVFDPFFTTRGRSEGTGIGLSVVHSIVDRHGGGINIDSSPNQGTRFRIYLPIELVSLEDITTETSTDTESSRPEASSTTSIATPQLQSHPSQRILIVDDQEHIVQLVARLCKSLGHEVTSTQDAAEAESFIRDNPTTFNLLVTDMTMPVMNGVQLARRAHTLAPDLSILLMTGNDNDLEREELASAGIESVITKPFGFKELAERIGDLLSK
jgi:signal transduction histidine kinase/CheY-like chemotaxis protein